jgi:nickel-dependent lactate racemase
MIPGPFCEASRDGLGIIMRIGIEFGRERLEVEVPQGGRIEVRGPLPAPPLPDPAAAVRDALENPLGFPALRRALTPDDHVVIVLDERLPGLAKLLTPLLEHVGQAGVSPETITLLSPPTAAAHGWLDELPDVFQDVHVEAHDPTNRRQLSYLATTRRGRRLYLNRTAVDADQLVVLSGRGYDPLLGYAGAAGLLYPALSDETTRQEMCDRLSLAVPGTVPWPVRREAEEVAWLLGAPFLVQIIEGAGEEIAHVVAGLADTSEEAHRLLDARWRGTVAQRADTVLAAVSGDPARHGFAELAGALSAAARVVVPNGRIILLSRAEPELGAGAALLRQAESPGQGLDQLRQHKPADMAAAFQWASTMQKHRVYLLSGLHAETAEELFTTPLDHAGQVQRLLATGGSYLVLPDAHKILVVPEA